MTEEAEPEINIHVNAMRLLLDPTPPAYVTMAFPYYGRTVELRLTAAEAEVLSKDLLEAADGVRRMDAERDSRDKEHE